MHSYEQKLTNERFSTTFTDNLYTPYICTVCTCIIGGPGGSDSGSDDNTGIIIGAVVGGICGAIVVVVVIVIVIYCCWCRNDKKKS